MPGSVNRGLGSATTLVYPTPVFQLFILGQLHTTASVRGDYSGSTTCAGRVPSLAWPSYFFLGLRFFFVFALLL